MDPRLLDVLHHATEVQLGAVVDGVHVDLHGVVEEPVDQHRMLRGDLGRPLDVGPQHLVVVNDLHPAPAEYVGRPYQDRIADPLRHRPGLGIGRRDPVRR